MDEAIKIRDFHFPDDYHAVYDLWSKAGEGIHLRSSDTFSGIKAKVERDPDLFIVAERGGEIIGAVLGGFDGRRGMVYHLAVSSSFRRSGTGQILMEELESRLRAKGCIRYYLLVTRDNSTAIRFYENRGWKNMEDLIIFGKDIT